MEISLKSRFIENWKNKKFRIVFSISLVAIFLIITGTILALTLIKSPLETANSNTYTCDQYNIMNCKSELIINDDDTYILTKTTVDKYTEITCEYHGLITGNIATSENVTSIKVTERCLGVVIKENTFNSQNDIELKYQVTNAEPIVFYLNEKGVVSLHLIPAFMIKNILSDGDDIVLNIGQMRYYGKDYDTVVATDTAGEELKDYFYDSIFYVVYENGDFEVFDCSEYNTIESVSNFDINTAGLYDVNIVFNSVVYPERQITGNYKVRVVATEAGYYEGYSRISTVNLNINNLSYRIAVGTTIDEFIQEATIGEFYSTDGMTASMIEGFDSSEEGIIYLKITYNDIVNYRQLSVYTPSPSIISLGIVIEGVIDEEYNSYVVEKDTVLDGITANLSIKNYRDIADFYTTAVIGTDLIITGLDTSVCGTQMATITYGDFSFDTLFIVFSNESSEYKLVDEIDFSGSINIVEGEITINNAKLIISYFGTSEEDEILITSDKIHNFFINFKGTPDDYDDDSLQSNDLMHPTIYFAISFENVDYSFTFPYSH